MGDRCEQCGLQFCECDEYAPYADDIDDTRKEWKERVEDSVVNQRFVTYDPITGEITGRITCSTRQAVLYPHRRKVTDEEFDERPELFQQVDVADLENAIAEKRTVALLPISEEAARKKGASEEFINEKIAQGKIIRKV